MRTIKNCELKIMNGGWWRVSRKGFTLVEVAVVMAVLVVVIAIALPNLMKMYMTANEGSVIEGMRAILLACENYQHNSTTGYPNTISDLTGANPAYLDSRFRPLAARGVLKGYQWTYNSPGGGIAIGTNAGVIVSPTLDRFTLRADPVTRGITGQRSFFVDETGVIRFNTRMPAGPGDVPLEQGG